jgi:hypothetical protein
MTNEMKLITALCDALGFDVETVCVNQDDIDYMLRGGASFRPDPIYEYKLAKSVDTVKTPEEPFTKRKESDEIFNTEMFGEVRISRDFAYGTTIDTKKGGEYFRGLVEENVHISSIIKTMDQMYIARGKESASSIPKKFIDDNLKNAKGSTMFDIPLEDLTKEELMCCVVASWDDEKKTRDAAINKNRSDLARFFWGKES